MENKKIIGFYDYTVVLTYLGMIFSFAGILNVINYNYTDSIICLMLAGLCDMFDGAVASTKARNCYEKHFGIEIDSMCDLISFGMLPALFVFIISGKTPGSALIAGAYLLCALIRLAYYNVQELDRQKNTDSSREVFLGLPVTTIAIVLPILYLIKNLFKINGSFSYQILILFIAAGFISGFEVKKPKLIGKIIMIVLGAFEFLSVFIFAGKGIL